MSTGAESCEFKYCWKRSKMLRKFLGYLIRVRLRSCRVAEGLLTTSYNFSLLSFTSMVLRRHELSKVLICCKLRSACHSPSPFDSWVDHPVTIIFSAPSLGGNNDHEGRSSKWTSLDPDVRDLLMQGRRNYKSKTLEHQNLDGLANPRAQNNRSGPSSTFFFYLGISPPRKLPRSYT